MFSQIAIFHAVNDLQNLPRLEGYTDVVIPKYRALTDYMGELCKRTEAIRGKLVKPREDNMLKVSTDGRKAALHLKLVGQQQPEGNVSKVCQCVDRVAALYRQFPDATQLIFCDYSTPKSEKFNVYDEIKEKLIGQGIPAKEIAFIHHYHTESRKLELFRKFNAGQMRILIGSTFKLGIGANVQVKLKAIHHLDVPWRPADMVQREGRILRRGNENREVQIYRYITEGSFDSYSWQILETKQRFITQFLSGSTYQRSVADLENNVLTYAQVKALALAQPLMKQLAEKENEIKNLRIILSREKQTLEAARQELEQMDEKITKVRTRWLTSMTAAVYLKKYSLEDFKSAYQSINNLLTDEVIAGSKQAQLPQVLGFRLTLPQPQDQKKPYILLCYSDQKYLVPMGDTPNGNARRVINALKEFDKIVTGEKEVLNKANDRKLELLQMIANPDDTYARRIVECEQEVAELRELITQNTQCA